MYRFQEHRIKSSYSKRKTSPVVIRPTCQQVAAAQGNMEMKGREGQGGRIEREGREQSLALYSMPSCPTTHPLASSASNRFSSYKVKNPSESQATKGFVWSLWGHVPSDPRGSLTGQEMPHESQIRAWERSFWLIFSLCCQLAQWFWTNLFSRGTEWEVRPFHPATDQLFSVLWQRHLSNKDSTLSDTCMLQRLHSCFPADGSSAPWPLLLFEFWLPYKLGLW